MKEEWRDVVGYEGLYMVSNMGNVYSHIRKKPLVKTLGEKGYYTVSLFRNRKRKEAKVHRLVAMAFIPNEENFDCINHKDECRTNNVVSNLEWCTKAYNNRYGTARFRAAKKRQKKIVQCTKSGEVIREWDSIKDAAETLGINRSNICQCCKTNKKYSCAGGFVWKYTEGGV